MVTLDLSGLDVRSQSPSPDSILARLPAGVAVRIAVDPDGCWKYSGAINEHGYAIANIGGTPRRLHRVVYALVHGHAARGDVDHTCHNDTGCPGGDSCPHRSCVRPDHLEDVTHRENVLRGSGPSAQQARRTHCPAGHPYAGDNLMTWRNHRYCRACKYAREKAARAAGKRD